MLAWSVRVWKVLACGVMCPDGWCKCVSQCVIYISSLIRSVIALHNLINNKINLKDAENEGDKVRGCPLHLLSWDISALPPLQFPAISELVFCECFFHVARRCGKFDLLLGAA
eukprot:3841709-Rhodomonas_salina.3